MPCASLAVSLAILAHADASPPYSEALFGKDVAATSRALRRAKVTPYGDIFLNHYRGCVTVRFVIAKNDDGFAFAADPFQASRSNTEPPVPPGKDDPDFRDVRVEAPPNAAGERSVLSFDWVSSRRGRGRFDPYRSYRMQLEAPGHAAPIVIDPKIGNTGVCFGTFAKGQYHVDC